MKFGTLYSYWSKDWDCDRDGYAKLIERVSRIGFDVLEVSADHIYKMPENDLKILNAIRKDHGVGITVNSGPSKEHDLASTDGKTRAAGIEYFDVIMNKMVLLETSSLAGAIYSFWPSDFLTTDKEGAWDRSIGSLKAVAKTAEALGITVSLEVLNRNETYILNTCEEAIDYCQKIGSRSMKLLLDTYHMNIEEDDVADAIRAAGSWLGHFHVGECNRRLPGANNSIDWKGVGAALNAITYDQAVVMEPFTINGGSVGSSIRLWRDLSGGADGAGMDRQISDSLSFLRGAFAQG